MRNFIIGILITLLIVLSIQYFSNSDSNKTALESSDLILNQFTNVGKLVVTEGHFSEVITYKDAKKMYYNVITATKKAIVVVNAKATISYDLSKIKYTLDQINKAVIIEEIPEPEIEIFPDIRYHELDEDLLNPFTPKDHNLIKSQVMEALHEKINNSTFESNAQNRLISELQKIYILTNSLNWELVFKEQEIQSDEALYSIFYNAIEQDKFK